MHVFLTSVVFLWYRTYYTVLSAEYQDTICKYFCAGVSHPAQQVDKDGILRYNVSRILEKQRMLRLEPAQWGRYVHTRNGKLM